MNLEKAVDEILTKKLGRTPDELARMRNRRLYTVVVPQTWIVKSSGSPFGANRRERRYQFRQQLSKLERKIAKEETPAAKMRLRANVRRLVAMQKAQGPQ